MYVEFDRIEDTDETTDFDRQAKLNEKKFRWIFIGENSEIVGIADLRERSNQAKMCCSDDSFFIFNGISWGILIKSETYLTENWREKSMASLRWTI